MTAATTLDVLTPARIAPVIVLDDPDQAEPLADALVAGGITTAEITLRTAAGLSAVKLFPAEMLGGARPDKAQSYLDHPAVIAIGGSWIVPPETLTRGDDAAIVTLGELTRSAPPSPPSSPRTHRPIRRDRRRRAAPRLRGKQLHH